MNGDYSRRTYDEARRYCALMLQQGRVLLDADFNEMVEILKERTRKLSLDAMGDPGIPFLTNPDAFSVSVNLGPLDLELAPGRIYVDGRMAEIFEDETFTYLGQPFLPDPPPLLDGDAAVVLCLWEEEVTWVMDTGLLDSALNGVDTATRQRTIIQVQVEEADAAECGLEVGDPPSDGRLTTRAIAPPAPDDPCILPPEAGFRGLVNSFYRVECHVGGPMGVARFKWSKDNGSIHVPVEAIAAVGATTELTVGRIGRDPVMRFQPGNWVTVTDDHRPWMDEPGEMAQIIDIIEGETSATVVLDRDITTLGRTFAAPPTDRHTRLQRWDQSIITDPTIDGEGLIPTQAAPITIDDTGIELTFSTDGPGGEFRRGDYWVFWARTATATIEELTEEPPQGIQRHYVQLAAASGLGGADPTITDCRPDEPDVGEGCCTFVVRPGESIQAAIDTLPPQGGCICLKAGVHPVPTILQLNRTNVHMHGESPGAILQGDAPLLQIGAAASAIRIEMIDFIARVGDGGTSPILMASGTQDLTIEDCRFAPLDSIGGIAVQLTRVDRARVTGNAIVGTAFGVVVNGLSDFPVIEKNDMIFGFGVADTQPGTGIWISGNASACHIEDNVILGAIQGIIVNDNPIGTPQSTSASTMIADNAILAGGFSNVGAAPAIGIDTAADFTTVTGNNVFLLTATGLGIRGTGAGSTITDNNVAAAGSDNASSVAIQIGHASPDGVSPLATGIQVTGNQIAGQVSGIAVLNAPGANVRRNNIVSLPAGTTAGIVGFASPLLTASGNRITGTTGGILTAEGDNTALVDNDMIGCPVGMFAFNDQRLTIKGNRVAGSDTAGIVAASVLGRTEFIENRVLNAGSNTPLAIGLGAAQILGEWHVEANEVTDTGQTAGGDMGGARAIGIFGLLVLEARVESNLVTYSDAFGLDPSREDRALFMLGLAEFVVNLGQAQVVFGFPIQVLGNKFIGAGASALVELGQVNISDNLRARFERVMVSDNYCMHVSGVRDDAATMVLTGRICTVGGNQIKATVPGFPSIDFNGMTGPFFGNAMNGPALGYTSFAPIGDGIHNMQQ